ncbi:MAG: DMT family transporter, partial [Chloroflexota bacterium]
SGKATLLGLLQSPIVVVLAIVFLGERLSPKHWLAGVLVLIGAFLINFDVDALAFNMSWGELLGIISPFCIGAGIVTMKSVVEKVNPIQVTGVALLIGAGMLSFSLPIFDVGVQLGVSVLLVILLMGIVRGTAWFVYYTTLPHIGASRAAIIFVSYAFFTVIFQLIMVAIAPDLGIRLPGNLLTALIGGIFIVSGIVVMNRA